MIKVNCPNCSTRLSAPDELVGKPVNCQKCNTKFVLSKRWMNAPIAVPEGADGSDAGDKSGSSNSSDGGFKNPGLIGNDSDHCISSSPLGIVAANFDLAEVENGFVVATADGAISANSTEVLSTNESSVSADREKTEMKADRNLVTNNRTRDLVSVSGTRAERNSDHQSATLPLPSGPEAFSTTPLKGFVETSLLLEFFDFRFRRYLAPGIIRLSWFLVLIASTVCLLFFSYLYLSSLLNRQKFAMPTLRSSAEAITPDKLPMSDQVGPATGEVSLVVPRFVYNSLFYFGYALLIVVSLLWIRVLFETIIMVFSIGSHLRDAKSRR